MRVLIFFLWLAHFLPLPILGRLGNAIGSLMYYAIPKRRKIALINLRLCMPELSEQERVIDGLSDLREILSISSM